MSWTIKNEYFMLIAFDNFADPVKSYIPEITELSSIAHIMWGLMVDHREGSIKMVKSQLGEQYNQYRIIPCWRLPSEYIRYHGEIRLYEHIRFILENFS